MHIHRSHAVSVTLAFVGLLGTLASGASAQPPELRKLVTEAPLVFLGTDLGAVESPTLPLPPPKGRWARVHVEETLRGAATIGDFTGQEVILDLPADEAHRTAIYFVRPVAYGKTLIAEQVAAMEVPESSEKLADELAEADRQNADDALRRRAASAEVVAVVRVVGVKALREAPRPSEHDPDWAIARVRVLRTLKGEPRLSDCEQGLCAEVAFAQSDDIRWFRSPKLAVYQEAILLLRPADPDVLREGEKPPAAYVLTHADDLRPPAEEARLAALIREPR